MPYISIKSIPKDDATKKEAVEKINQILLDVWKCPQEAISISVEEIPFDEWNEKVFKPEMEPKLDKMYILDGKKKF